MAKSAVLGLMSGLAVVVLTLIIVGVVNLPQASGAVSMAHRTASRCGTAEVVQDQGYGIARTVTRQVCPAVSAD